VHEVYREQAAQRDLNKLSAKIFPRIIPHIKAIAKNPRPAVVNKTTGARKDWRIRIGDHLLIYEVDAMDTEEEPWGIGALLRLYCKPLACGVGG